MLKRQVGICCSALKLLVDSAIKTSLHLHMTSNLIPYIPSEESIERQGVDNQLFVASLPGIGAPGSMC